MIAVSGELNIDISTHTLTWSVTILRNFCTSVFSYFNSHAHVERDAPYGGLFLFSNISTHTLTWSVTVAVETLVYKPYISTHTLTWSVTGAISAGLTGVKDFNSHAHVERDESNLNKRRCESYFNSHAHVERDLSISMVLQYVGISTHTLTWSVTSLSRVNLIISKFQLTRSRGA